MSYEKVFWEEVTYLVGRVQTLSADIKVEVVAPNSGRRYPDINPKALHVDSESAWFVLEGRSAHVTLLERDKQSAFKSSFSAEKTARNKVAQVLKFSQAVDGKKLLTSAPEVPASMMLTCPHCESRIEVLGGDLDECRVCRIDVGVSWSRKLEWHLVSWQQ